MQESTCEITNTITPQAAKTRDFAICPNPAIDFIQIESADGSLMNVTIYILCGSVVKRIPNYLGSSKIDVNDLNKGIYFVSLFTEKSGLLTYKLLID